MSLGTEQAAELAHSSPHRRRPRLVPLTVLMSLVVAAAVVGAVHGGTVTSGVPASALPQDPAVKAAKKAAKAKRQCMPAFDTHVTSEPWSPSRRAASEKVFKKQMEKEAPGYVSGKDGWKFFTDYQNENFSQAIGRVTQSAGQQKRWAAYLATSQKTVEAAGGRYFAVVAPANWDVYPGKLPSWAKPLRGTTSLDRLEQAHPELPFIDPRAALAKAAKTHATYEGLDSHWTPYGGYVAWRAITRCLATSDKAFKPLGVPALAGVGIEANSDEFAADGVKPGKPRRTYPEYAAPHPASTATHLPDGAPIALGADFATDTLQAPLKTSTPDAQLPDATLLTLRDSTGNALSPLWSTSFGTTIQYPHGIGQQGLTPPDLGKLVATYHPDVVLFVMTERFLSLEPPK